MRSKNIPVVKVTWADACTFEGINKAHKKCPVRETIGYLLRNDKDAVAICYLYDLRADDFVHDADESECILIPKGMIITLDYYEPLTRPGIISPDCFQSSQIVSAPTSELGDIESGGMEQ